MLFIEVVLLWLAMCSQALLSWALSGRTKCDFVTGQGHNFVL